MSLDTTLARISAIETAFQPTGSATGGVAAEPSTGAATATDSTSFSHALGQATALTSPTTLNPATLGQAGALGLTTAPSSSGALAAVEIARTQVGQAENPPGSNESPAIAEYRSAVTGAVVGPWCADFASWAAARAGIPLGENGEGFQSVGELWSWAERSGRAVPVEAGPPQAGDLIVWGSEHVGIVESVDPDGTVHTIEGNSSDQVAQRTYGPGESGATGYVRLG